MSEAQARPWFQQLMYALVCLHQHDPISPFLQANETLTIGVLSFPPSGPSRPETGEHSSRGGRRATERDEGEDC